MGAQSKAREAGISIIGGHTVDDTEPKFGLAVTGIIDNDKIITNSNAKPGDKLILTKPIGTGILSTALKQGVLSDEGKELLIFTMSELNDKAAVAMQNTGVNACTDVTGFGLVGHLMEMMNASGTTAVINYNEINLLPDVTSLAAGGIIPGGTVDNFNFTKSSVKYSEKLSEVRQLIINDAQTSGGLLISVPGNRASTLLHQLHDDGVKQASIIGIVKKKNEHAIIAEL
jgi:selenide,water dikinase